ncbi:terpene synthase metal-binding domain-containing protein [Tolypothrix sp. NIES-4075]|uniref:terpene synthase family protein n=1 Tax=Tolypothrix sp. NIES-4075 TaxID=2005459 RepID=UPI000B5C6FF2|nr:terpene synthase family protein [Tolypothrix sp. NIES-4075]GAX40392.1 terpene synthase metal-binding domain-containing protein [Tolypothrix sp. NIES-4075]
MNEFILPELYCPFPSQINKYADVLEDYSLEWVLRFNLLANESSYRRFCKSKFFWLVAVAYPYCKLEELKIVNDWISWLFIWDDQCDMSDLGKQPEVLKDFHKRFLEILNGSEIKSKDIPLGCALKDLRQRTLRTGKVEWFHHFLHAFEDYFHGCLQEASNRAQEIVPDVDTYIKIRRSSVGVNPSLALTEFCNQLIIPDFLRNHDLVKKIKIMTINILAWCNDIFSVSREMASGDVHNLVLVLHYQQQLTFEQAIKYAAEMHNQEVRSMMNLEASIPSFGEQADAELTKYISGMHAWISGTIDWYARSGRYQTRERLELVKS